ncbi:MAG: transglutaminase domain-containing protein, partial [Planctomycetota bacterium]
MQAERMEGLLPGSAHPYAPCTHAAMAKSLGVPEPYIGRWVEEGMEAVGDRVDPFTVSNWVARHRLSDVPALMRRWQNFLNWFYPHVQDQDAPRSYRWQRRHRIYLPHAVMHMRWVIPTIPHEEGVQEVSHVTPMRSEGRSSDALAGLVGLASWREQGDFWRLDQDQAPPGLQVGQTVQLVRSPVRILDSSDSEHEAIVRVLEPLVGAFEYGYRQHLIVDSVETARERWPEGSCLDCALLAGAALNEAGWATRLCGGIISHTLIANPHFWLEVATDRGWVPVDPSLPAIARMLRIPWRNWLMAYIGGSDSRRILISRGHGDFPGLTQCS